MMLKLPSSSTFLSSSSSCNAALIIRKQCRSFGASSDSSSRLKALIRRRNDAVSCEAADSSASSSAPLVAETKEKDAGGRVGKSATDRLRQGTLTEDGLSYKEKFIVRCYEVGVNKTATVETIANLLQEVACNHVQSLGFSTDGFGTTTTMRKLHLIWATARMHIEIYKYPAWSDVVEIETWYESEGPIWTRRDWILKDYATREVIGRATSKFVMMNQHTRRFEKVSDDVRKEYLGFCPREPRYYHMFASLNSGTIQGFTASFSPSAIFFFHLSSLFCYQLMKHEIECVSNLEYHENRRLCSSCLPSEFAPFNYAVEFSCLVNFLACLTNVTFHPMEVDI